ncbi:hypothetical protein SFB3_015G0, partial [Candidatus Arthromitus sp. SFB-3]
MSKFLIKEFTHYFLGIILIIDEGINSKSSLLKYLKTTINTKYTIHPNITTKPK